jgi:O-acetylserine/cysteine efflux transporter
MKARDVFLAVAVAAVWGFNFVVIHVGLEHLPPLAFSALRFGLAALPAVFFVPRPALAWQWIVAVGLILGVVKFSLLFAGMNAGMPAGLSSVVLQAQAIFTLVFATVLLRERPRVAQLLGLAVAAAGIALMAWRLGPDRPPAAFALVLAAAVAWSLSNVVMRKAAPANMLSFMVWVSLVAAPVLVVLSLLFEGPDRDLAALRSLDLTSIGALVYIAGVSTLAGFGAWGALIRRYGASTVAPFSMLVPMFGITFGILFLHESPQASDVIGSALVVGGVLLGAIRLKRRGRDRGDTPANAGPAATTAPSAGTAPVRLGV